MTLVNAKALWFNLIGQVIRGWFVLCLPSFNILGGENFLKGLSFCMSLQKKVVAITQKIDALKAEQRELEKSISGQLFDVIKSLEGFSVPFPTLVGCIMDSIEKCKRDSEKSEEWQLAGEKFLKAKSRSSKTLSNRHS